MINIVKISKVHIFKGVIPLKPWEGIYIWIISIPKLSKICVFEGVTSLKLSEDSNIWIISWLGIKPWKRIYFRGSDSPSRIISYVFSMSILPIHISGPSVNLKSTRTPQSFSLRSILSHNLCHWYTISNQDKPHWSWNDHIY